MGISGYEIYIRLYIFVLLQKLLSISNLHCSGQNYTTQINREEFEEWETIKEKVEKS